MWTQVISQSDSIVRQTNKRSFLSDTTMNNIHIFNDMEVICGQQQACLREAGFLILIYFLHTSNKNVSRLSYFKKDETFYFSPNIFPLLMLVSGHCKPQELSWNNEKGCEIQAEIQNFPISSNVPQMFRVGLKQG